MFPPFSSVCLCLCYGEMLLRVLSSKFVIKSIRLVVCLSVVTYCHLFQLMLQSSGKVARGKVRPTSKLSNQKPGSSRHTKSAVHTASAGVNHHTGSSTNKSNDSSAMLPAEVEQIFEVKLSTDTIIYIITCVITYLLYAHIIKLCCVKEPLLVCC